MALLFCDSFDHYDTGGLPRKWSVYDPTFTANFISPGGGRNGSQGYHINQRTAIGGIWKSFSPRSSWVMGVAYRPDGSNGGEPQVRIFVLIDGPNALPQCDLSLLADMTLAITRNGVILAGGVSTNALVPGTYYYIEMRVTISASVGANTCSVNVNGVEWLSVTAGQSTKNTANTTANLVALGRAGIASAQAATGDYDDFYVCDNSGSVNNTFLGDVMIQPLYPANIGGSTQWTPTGSANNWANVNDHPGDDETTFNQSSVAGQVDVYSLDQMTGSPTIKAVQWNAKLLKTDASSYVLNRAVRSGSTIFFGAPSLTPNTTYFNYTEVLETNPNTGSAWTATTVNAMQAGQKLVSVV